MDERENSLNTIIPLLEKIFSCIYSKDIQLKLDSTTDSQLKIKFDNKSFLENISGIELSKIYTLVNDCLTKHLSIH